MNSDESSLLHLMPEHKDEEKVDWIVIEYIRKEPLTQVVTVRQN
jgi:hypothetical protein